MKVVFVSFYESESMGGGAGKVAHEITQAHAKKYETLLVRPGDKNRIIQKSKLLTEVLVKSRNEGEYSLTYLGVPTVRHIFKSLEDFSPDIIHAQELDPLALVIQVWAIINNVPFIHTVHVYPSKRASFGTEDISPILGKIVDSKPIERYSLDFFHSCDAIISLNKFVEQDLRDFGYKGISYIIPNGRNFSLYSKLKYADITSKETKLLFIGFLSTRKNQEYLLKVMKNLPRNFKLTLIGNPHSKKYLEILNRNITKNKLQSRIKIVSKIEHTEIPKYFENTHFFVSASLIELQSLVVIEALMSGTPVIALSNDTTDELVTEDVGFLFPNRIEPKDFTNKVKQLSQLSKPKYEKMCQNARKSVTHLDWDNIINETRITYHKVIRDKKRKNTKERFSQLQKIWRFIKDADIKKYLLEYFKNTIKNLQSGEILNIDLLELKEKKVKKIPGRILFYAIVAVAGSLIGVSAINIMKKAKKVKEKLK